MTAPTEREVEELARAIYAGVREHLTGTPAERGSWSWWRVDPNDFKPIARALLAAGWRRPVEAPQTPDPA